MYTGFIAFMQRLSSFSYNIRQEKLSKNLLSTDSESLTGSGFNGEISGVSRSFAYLFTKVTIILSFSTSMSYFVLNFQYQLSLYLIASSFLLLSDWEDIFLLPFCSVVV